MGIQIRGSDDTIIAADGSLSVAGYAFPTSDGSSGQYLQTNGTGTLSWQTISDVGKVVNYSISSFYATQESTTSTSYVDTSFTATYTPASSSNKVLLIHQFQDGARRGYGHYYDIKRTVGATTTQLASSYTQGIIGSYSAANDSNRLAQIVWLDSPATTSEITYRLIHKAGSTSYAQYVYNSSQPAFYLFVELEP